MNEKINYKHICAEDTYIFSYTQMPDILFEDAFSGLALECKVLYSFMLRRISLSKKNHWIDENGDVYIHFRTDEIMSKFSCSNKTAGKFLSELEEIGLIERKKQGQGKPDIIYVNKINIIEDPEDISNMDNKEPELPIENLGYPSADKSGDYGKNRAFPEVKNLHFKKCKNYMSGSVENTSQEVKKVHASYKDNNYKDIAISSSTNLAIREHVRISEEEEEYYMHKFDYQIAAQKYGAQIVKAVFDEVVYRNSKYLDMLSAEMFERICKAVYKSRDPIVSMSGFVGWCLDQIVKSPHQSRDLQGKPNQFNTFMQRGYDFEALERELVSN